MSLWCSQRSYSSWDSFKGWETSQAFCQRKFLMRFWWAWKCLKNQWENCKIKRLVHKWEFNVRKNRSRNKESFISKYTLLYRGT